MPSYALITPDRFRDRRWRRYRAMPFAAEETAVPLAANELSRAIMHLPVAFTAVPGGDAEDAGAAPVAVLGVSARHNELVSPEGKWFGGYMPAAFRGYPFALQRAADDRVMLCIDESAGLVGDEGEPFFDEAGEPAPETRRVLEFLVKLEAGYRAGRAQGALLRKHGLPTPWRPTVTVAGRRITLGGLQRVDEAALAALAPAALAALRDGGALAMAYAHLYSLQHLGRLVGLAERRAQAASSEASIDELFGEDEEVLSFDL
jgi:hypothetical protein